jgi:coenzyme F420-reducing hydrogenase gamma subunit
MKLNEKVLPLGEVVKVDYNIRGCPPDADTIFHVLNEFLNDRVPDPAMPGKLRYG